MFTGIINHCGLIEDIHRKKTSTSLMIHSLFSDLELGESIAVDGTCLTVTQVENNHFMCELSPETLKLTIANSYEKGAQVNLERALRLTDRLGGHFVTGHVDTCCRVEHLPSQAECQEVLFASDLRVPAYLTQKGSITINGVSLTINAVTQNGFSVMLIPYTLTKTNLSRLVVGSLVNIEYDYLAKIVINHLVNDDDKIYASND